MLALIKSTLKNSVIYGFGNIATKIVGFILLPFYTQTLAVSDYGVLGMMEVTADVLIATFGLNLYYSYSRWYWDDKHKSKQKEITFTTFTFLIAVSMLMIISMSLSSGILSKILFDSTKYSYLIVLMATSAGFMIAGQIPASLMQLKEKALLFAISNVIRLIISLGLTILFVVGMKRNVEGIYEAQIISYFIYFLMLTKFIWKNMTPKFEPTILKSMLQFSFPLMLASVANIALSVSDRYFLKFMASLKDVGTYSLGYKMANTIKVFLVTSIQLALTPILFKSMNKDNVKRIYSKSLTYFTYITMLAVLFMSMFGKEIIKLIAQKQEYWPAYQIIPIISFGVIFTMMKDNVAIGLSIEKKTKTISLVIIFSSFINIGLNCFLVKYYQSYGAATSFLVSQIIYFFLIFHYAQKCYPVNYEKKKLSYMFILGLCLYAISTLTTDCSLLIRLVVKSGLIMSFPVILYYLNFYEQAELDTVRKALNSYREVARKYLQ